MTRQVVVGDAGYLPTTRQIGWALAPWLTAYYTPLRAGQFGPLERVPPFSTIAGRRQLPEPVRPVGATVRSVTEAARLAAVRAGLTRGQYRLIWRRNRTFDARLARRIEPDTLLIGQYGACLTCLRETRTKRGRVVLDHPIAEQGFGLEILAEEAARRPGFADTIAGRGAGVIGRRELARITREALEADLVVVGSEFAASTFHERLPTARVAVASYGADTSLFRPDDGPRREGPLRVLFAGQLSQRKGISYVLEALDRLDPARFELTLVGPVVGEGAWRHRHDGFRHLGGVSGEAMPEVYRQADVLVLPSLLEGSAVVVLEALASGVPVIVTPNVGADAVSDGVEGFVVPIRDPDAIADRLQRLADDAELLAAMRRAARARAEAGMDWADFRTRFVQVLLEAELLDRAGSAAP